MDLVAGSRDRSRDRVDIRDEGGVSFARWVEWIFDAHVQLPVRTTTARDREPTAAADSEQRGFGKFGPAQDADIKRSHAIFGTWRASDLDVMNHFPLLTSLTGQPYCLMSDGVCLKHPELPRTALTEPANAARRKVTWPSPFEVGRTHSIADERACSLRGRTLP
ncbi:hypothetical protein [Nocardia concava]|uniref:hypothetical protein n=1 Tax=Nocardia concava TaxID=257281 RepID=UPI00157B72A9|nr:hypothetical protein [Nocardia concava]